MVYEQKEIEETTEVKEFERMNKNFDYKENDHIPNLTKLVLDLRKELMVYVNPTSINIVDRSGTTILTITGINLQVHDWWGWGAG